MRGKAKAGKRAQRLVAALLAAVLLGTVLVACAGSGGGSDAAPREDGREVIQVSVAHWQLTEPNGHYAGQKLYDKILEDFGIELVIVPVTWADADEKVRMFASSDDLPDIFDHMAWVLKAEFKTYVDQGLIREIPEALYTKYAHVNRVMQAYSHETMPDGLMYHLPRDDRAWEDTNGNPIGLVYRVDYATSLGYAREDFLDMSIEDLTTFLYDLTYGDPDGNGVDDTYGLTNAMDTGIGFIRELIFPMFGWRPWVYENGEWVYGFVSEPAKQAAQWLNTLYLDGVLDPEFAITVDSQLREKISIGRVGCVPDNINTTNATLFRRTYWQEINPDLDINEYLDVIPLPSREDGTRNSSPKDYWSATCVSSKVDDAKLDRILELFDWLYSVEGYTFTAWGEENVDYEIVEGIITSLLTDADGNPQQFMTGSPLGYVSNLAGWHLDGLPDADESSVAEWDLHVDSMLKETYWPYNYPFDFSKYLFTDALEAFDIDTYVESQLVVLIMQATDFENDWQAFVDDLYQNYNLAAVSADVNEAAAEQGIEWEPYYK